MKTYRFLSLLGLASMVICGVILTLVLMRPGSGMRAEGDSMYVVLSCGILIIFGIITGFTGELNNLNSLRNASAVFLVMICMIIGIFVLLNGPSGVKIFHAPPDLFWFILSIGLATILRIAERIATYAKQKEI